jgi:hypothetical protein
MQTPQHQRGPAVVVARTLWRYRCLGIVSLLLAIVSLLYFQVEISSLSLPFTSSTNHRPRLPPVSDLQDHHHAVEQAPLPSSQLLPSQSLLPKPKSLLAIRNISNTIEVSIVLGEPRHHVHRY